MKHKLKHRRRRRSVACKKTMLNGELQFFVANNLLLLHRQHRPMHRYRNLTKELTPIQHEATENEGV
jgi:hypothetical protein